MWIFPVESFEMHLMIVGPDVSDGLMMLYIMITKVEDLEFFFCPKSHIKQIIGTTKKQG